MSANTHTDTQNNTEDTDTVNIKPEEFDGVEIEGAISQNDTSDTPDYVYQDDEDTDADQDQTDEDETAFEWVGDDTDTQTTEDDTDTQTTEDNTQQSTTTTHTTGTKQPGTPTETKTGLVPDGYTPSTTEDDTDTQTVEVNDADETPDTQTVEITNDGTNLFLDYPTDNLTEAGFEMMEKDHITLDVNSLDAIVTFLRDETDAKLEFTFDLFATCEVTFNIVEHYRGDYGRDRIGIAGDTREVKDSIKADWETTHHDFDFDDELWHIDANALEFVCEQVRKDHGVTVDVNNETDADVYTNTDSSTTITFSEPACGNADKWVAVTDTPEIRDVINTTDVAAEQTAADTWHVKVTGLPTMMKALA